MTIDIIRQQLAAAASDQAAPPALVSSADVYRAGLRRRWVRRWFSGGVAALAVVGVTAGAALLAAPGQRPAVDIVVGVPDRPAEQQPPSPLPPPSPKRTCKQLANEVTAVLRSALPADLEWQKPFNDPSMWNKPCGHGILFYVRFERDGKKYSVGFEGGTLGESEPGCSADRNPVHCDRIPGGEIGHIVEERGNAVLLSQGKLGFYLVVNSRGKEPPFTTAELAAVARKIAAKVSF